MPQGLSRRTALVLVAVAFGLTLGVGLLLAGGPTAQTPQPKPSAQSIGADVPAAEPDVRLVAAGTVPALREPRRPRARKPKHTVRKVTRVAPTVSPAPVQPVAPVPTPTATPHYIPPTPPPSAPVPKPSPTAAPPASGTFDTSGDES